MWSQTCRHVEAEMGCWPGKRGHQPGRKVSQDLVEEAETEAQAAIGQVREDGPGLWLGLGVEPWRTEWRPECAWSAVAMAQTAARLAGSNRDAKSQGSRVLHQGL